MRKHMKFLSSIHTVIICASAFAVLSCAQQRAGETKSKDSSAPSSQPTSMPASQPAQSSTKDGKVKRGAEFTVAEETTLAQVLKAPDSFEGKTVKIRGKVARCCVKKGCWMELTAEGVDRGMRIRFKDYGFFVPLDSAGAQALVEGQVNTRKLDEPTAKHLAEEGAEILRNEAGEAIELGMVATAVELTR